MNVLCLSKRHYTGHDLHRDAYGRIAAFASALRTDGAEVRGISYNYRGLLAGSQHAGPHGEWLDLGLAHALGGLAMPPRRPEPRPELVVSCSDALHVVRGAALARKSACPHLVDLYDDFEAFGLTRRLPGLARRFRAALAAAQGIVCVSDALADRVAGTLPRRAIEVIGNGVDPNLFRPLPMADCRNALRLPAEGPLLAVPGGLDALHGVDDLFAAWRVFSARVPTGHLVLAGRPDAMRVPPDLTRVIDLGRLGHQRMPLLYNAADLVVIPNASGRFGDACHPMKLSEALACRRPLLAARTTSVSGILGAQQSFLYAARDPAEFVARAGALLHNPRLPHCDTALSWENLGARFAGFARATAAKPATGA